MNKYRYAWGVKRASFVLIPLFILNYIGIVMHLYSAFWWWDIFTHFLGGIGLGFLVYGVVIHNTPKNWGIDRVWLIWLLTLFCIFLGWELYEIIISQYLNRELFYNIDTLHDIINDLLGALVAYYWTREFL